MLRSLKGLEGYTLAASDGEIGSVSDFYFDDERWAVRYLVAKTGGLLRRRHVLISPMSFREVDWTTQRFHLALTKRQIEESPSIDLDQPVSRKCERELHGYYGYSVYWGYPGLWGVAGYPAAGPTGDNRLEAWGPDATLAPEPDSGDVHLRSLDEVRKYDIQAPDGSMGQVDDFIADDASWAVRYLVVDTSKWWFGKKVLVSPEWASRISWASKTVFVDLSRQQIESAPPWEPKQAVSREYEERLHGHYRRPVYWHNEA